MNYVSCSHLQADNGHPEEAPSPGVLAHGLLHDGEEDVMDHWAFELLVVDQGEDIDSRVTLHKARPGFSSRIIG